MTEPVPVDDFVPCKVCGNSGWLDVEPDVPSWLAKCPCRLDDEPTCDPLCRCSGGPL